MDRWTSSKTIWINTNLDQYKPNTNLDQYKSGSIQIKSTSHTSAFKNVDSRNNNSVSINAAQFTADHSHSAGYVEHTLKIWINNIWINNECKMWKPYRKYAAMSGPCCHTFKGHNNAKISTYGDLTRTLLGDSIREGVLQGSCVKVDASTAARKPAGFVQLRGWATESQLQKSKMCTEQKRAKSMQCTKQN